MRIGMKGTFSTGVRAVAFEADVIPVDEKVAKVIDLEAVQQRVTDAISAVVRDKTSIALRSYFGEGAGKEAIVIKGFQTPFLMPKDSVRIF
jgi:hypothetical protein